MRKLRSFGVLLTSFYDSVVASTIFYEVCWSSSISAAGRKQVDELIKKANTKFDDYVVLSHSLYLAIYYTARGGK